jgi:RNA chaperone Hfq
MSTQFAFLNTLRRERRLVVVYLIGGTRLQGRIASFDQQGVLLETKTGIVLCSQDQISTLGPDIGRAMLRTRPRVGPVATDGALEVAANRPTRVADEALSPRPLASESVRPDDLIVSDAELATARERKPQGPPASPVITQKVRRKIEIPDLQTSDNP